MDRDDSVEPKVDVEGRRTEVQRSLRMGGLLYVVGLVGFGFGSDLPVVDLLFLPALLFLLPALAVAQLPLVENEEVERIPAYLGSAAGILVLGLASAALGLRLAGPAELGLLLPPGGVLLSWSVGLSAAGIGIMWVFHRVEVSRGTAGSKILRQLMPRTGRERAAFAGLSFAAGTGEEVAYRGYVIVALVATGLSPVLAAVGSSVAFGYLHAYQGRIGVVRTGLLGFILAVSFLATGSLWPAMIAHVTIDLVGGLVLGPRWMEVGTESA